MTMENDASSTLRANHVWHIFTHRKADGDAIGSANALIEAGKLEGHSVFWHSPDEKLPEGYGYLPHFAEHITTETFVFDGEGLFVFLDCANETRSVSGFKGSINSLNIDHHEDNSHYARVNCVDGKASSTCEMLFRVFKAGGWEITRTIAESLYTGLFTDTGSFTYSNTSPLTHRIAAELIEAGAEPGHMTDLITQNKTSAGMALWACAMSRIERFGPDEMFAVARLYAEDFARTGADMTETEGLPAMLMAMRGVKFLFTATEYPNASKRLSFRSREGSPFNAGEISRELGGGGHERAAGANFEGSVDEAVEAVKGLLLRKYDAV